MRISINKNTDLSNKYLRFLKWKIYQLAEKFGDLIYVEVFLNSEGQSPKIYVANIRLGIAGKDIILKDRSKNLWVLFQRLHRKAQQNLARQKQLNKEKRVDFSRQIYQEVL